VRYLKLETETAKIRSHESIRRLVSALIRHGIDINVTLHF